MLSTRLLVIRLKRSLAPSARPLPPLTQPQSSDHLRQLSNIPPKSQLVKILIRTTFSNQTINLPITSGITQ